MGLIQIEDGRIKNSAALPDPIPSANLLAVQTLERYSNHLGAVDNFMQTTVSGNGTVTADATNHEMDLTSGITLVGGSSFETKKTWILGKNPIAVTMIINNLAGDNSMNAGWFGLADIFGGAVVGVTIPSNGCIFRYSNAGWRIYTVKDTNTSLLTTAAVTNGDVITVVATSAKVSFYLNGVSLGTLTTMIPTAALKAGGGVKNASGTAVDTTASIDQIDISRYLL